jgi:hypothetical protein
MLREVADEVVVPETPARFWAVGQHYRRFDQTTDAENQSIGRQPPAKHFGEALASLSPVGEHHVTPLRDVCPSRRTSTLTGRGLRYDWARRCRHDREHP